MTVKEAAVLWDVSEWRVRSWCRKGYLEAAAKVGGRWLIPEGTRRPYLSRKRKFTRPYQKTDYVREAIGSGLYLDFRLLALSREEFTQRAEMLVRSGEAERTGEGWRLTLAGENFLRKLDSDARKELRETISTAASLIGPALTILDMVA